MFKISRKRPLQAMDFRSEITKFRPLGSSCQPLNWMKTCNYEFSLPQKLDDHKHNKGHTFMVNATNGSTKLNDLQSHVQYIENSINIQQISCSSIFLQN